MISGARSTRLIDKNLRALRTGKALDSEFVNLVLAAARASNGTPNVPEYLEDLVWKEYALLRYAHQFDATKPHSEEAARRHLADSSRNGNGKLASWCALYFRYLAAVELSVDELANAAGVVPQQFRRRVMKGLEYLSQKLTGGDLVYLEHQPSERSVYPDREFTKLLGAGEQLNTLQGLLLQETSPRLISLEGIGGIGKTALARACIDLHNVTLRWPHIVWVSARQTTLTDEGQLSSLSNAAATLMDVISRICKRLELNSLVNQPLQQQLNGLKATLKRQPHLIVVDNLETVSDYEQLVPALADIVGQSKVLITTRKSLRQFPFVHTLVLRELNETDALELITLETARRGRIANLSGQDFQLLYSIIGGLPLALKLVAGQFYLKPIEVILEGFRKIRSNTDDVYRYIYWNAWHSLSQDAQLLLLAFLPSDPDGEDPAFLQLMSGLVEDKFYAALKELAHVSLLEFGGSVSRPTYRLHRLTITFLQTDVLKLWSPN